MIRFLIAPAALVMIAFPAFSQTSASTGDVYACATLEADAERLACYDTAVGRLKAAEDAGEVATVTRAEVEQVQKESFGFSIPSLPKLALPKLGSDKSDSAELAQIEFAVTKIKPNAYKKLTVTLENGQVWQQTDSDSVYYSKKKPPKTAVVKSSRFGGFKMKLDGGTAFRVKRVE